MRKNKKYYKSNKIRKNNNFNSDTLSIESEYIKRKEKITSFFFSHKSICASVKELASLISVPKKDINILKQILEDLKKEAVITRNDNGKYSLVNEKNSFKCTFELKDGGFGFGIILESDLEDIYIPKENTLNALDGDTILVILENTRKYGHKREKVGRVIKILDRKNKFIVGKIYSASKNYFVKPILPYMPSVYINNKEDAINFGIDSLVKVNITSYPNNSKDNYRGNIVEYVSCRDEIDSYVKALYYSYELNEKEEFNVDVINELKSIKDRVLKKELLGRENKTSDNVYTIDSYDSKDLDDAVCVKKVGKDGFLLSVHIADVSHYVKHGTAIDKEAIKRATSIYVPGSVIPMIPKKLSNGICSLNEGKVRLTLSVDMHINKEGEVTKSRIYKSYIKSKKKMTYEKVYKCITKSDKRVLNEYKDYIDDINVMVELASILKEKRNSMGSINFDIPETKIELNKDGSLKDVHPYEKNISNDIIEEFMLITNMTVAEKFKKLDAPFIYRTHEKPDEEKLKNLNLMLSQYNKRINFKKGVTPKDIANILSNFETEEEKDVISNITLRALKLAKYDNECLGHFGLAFKYYCHFTSPIRRYPDLFIHRVISDYLSNGMKINNNCKERYLKQAESYSVISSEMEREASKIEREFDSMYTAIFMKEKIGEECFGVISSVTSFGFFVKLPSTAEGLVHISNLDGYYEFDEARFRLIGRNGRVYKIGDKVKIKVDRVDVRLKQIDFVLT